MRVEMTCGSAAQRWARSVQGPSASTATSQGTGAPSTDTAATSPAGPVAMPSTTPVTSRAPCATASSTSARVNRRGSTWAVVSGVPMTSCATTAGSSQAGVGRRRWRSRSPAPATVASTSSGRWPIRSAPSSAASSRWSAKEARPMASSGVPSFQSAARNPDALPDAAAAGPRRSTMRGGAPLRASAHATAAPITPAPHTTIRAGGSMGRIMVHPG